MSSTKRRRDLERGRECGGGDRDRDESRDARTVLSQESRTILENAVTDGVLADADIDSGVCEFLDRCPSFVQTLSIRKLVSAVQKGTAIDNKSAYLVNIVRNVLRDHDMCAAFVMDHDKQRDRPRDKRRRTEHMDVDDAGDRKRSRDRGRRRRDRHEDHRDHREDREDREDRRDRREDREDRGRAERYVHHGDDDNVTVRVDQTHTPEPPRAPRLVPPAVLPVPPLSLATILGTSGAGAATVDPAMFDMTCAGLGSLSGLGTGLGSLSGLGGIGMGLGGLAGYGTGYGAAGYGTGTGYGSTATDLNRVLLETLLLQNALFAQQQQQRSA